MDEYIYTDSKGKQFQLHQLSNSHLVNALCKKVVESVTVGVQAEDAVRALKAEVLKRMPIQ